LTVVSFLSSSLVAAQTGYSLTGDWMVGDRATNEHYAPLETFEERFEGLLRLTRDLGFEAIDLWTAHLSPAWATDEHLTIARALLEEHGLPVVSLAGGFGGTADELRASCRVAHGVGTDLLGGNLGFLASDRDEAVAILEGEGIRFAIENHPGERTPADVLRQIGDGANGRVGTALDTGWWVTNGFDPVVAVHELKDALFHVHLKDVFAPEFERDHRNAAHTEGAVPLEETVAALLEVGYTGPIAVEDHPFDRDPTTTLRRSRELLEGWLEQAA
jgi:sugar phosphate isomerase/epimerase